MRGRQAPPAGLLTTTITMTTAAASRQPVLVLFDQNLRSATGHYLSYAAAVAGAARAAGVRAVVAGHLDVNAQHGSLEIVPAFSRTYWQELVCGDGHDPYRHISEGARLVADAVTAVCAEHGVGEGDALFFPNANLVQAAGLALVADRMGVGLPRTALLFRRDCEEHGRLMGVGARTGCALLRHVLAELCATPGGGRVRLLTDSDELSDDYAEATARRFQTAPIPVDPRISASTRSDRQGRPATATYLGDARMEKGYRLLPELAAVLRPMLEADSLRLVIQSNFNTVGGEPGIADARRALAAQPNVVLLDEPLGQDAYVEWLDASDLVVLPYQADQYVARTSGILAEALCAGLPAVVPGGCWLSVQVRRHGAGRTFVSGDARSLVAAVQSVLADLPSATRAAAERRGAYAGFHNPSRLVEFVCGADLLRRAGRIG